MTTTTTRRNLLRIGTTAAAYAAGATIVTGGVAIASQAKGETLSPGLAVRIQRHRAARAAQDHIHATIINPGYERQKEARAQHQRRIDAIPHVEAPGGVSLGGQAITFTSRNNASRRMAEVYLDMDAENPNRSADWAEMVDGARRFIKADDARNDAIRALGDEPLFANLRAVEDEAYEPVHAARNAILDFPCNTFVDFKAKLAWLQSDDGMDGEDLLSLVMADVQRIAANGGNRG